MFPVLSGCYALLVTVVTTSVLTSALAAPGSERSGSAQGDAGAVASDTAITIAFGGDVSLGRHVNLVAARDGSSAPLEAVDELRAADLALVNIESVEASAGERTSKEGLNPVYFRGRPETLAVLRDAGIDVVTTANSHSGDYGVDALLERQDHLAAMGIAGPGSGVDRASACAPAYVEIRGIVIAIFSFDTSQPAFAAGEGTPGTCHVALGNIDAIRSMYEPLLLDARERAHVVLVAPHWGVEFEHEPSRSKREAGRLLIDLGADAVLGSHAHLTQGVELHDGRPILHDAGNLLLSFDEPNEAALFELSVTVEGIQRIELVPLVAERGWTRRASEAEAAEIEAAFARRSMDLGTEVRERQVDLDPAGRPAPTRDAPISQSTPGPSPAAITRPPPECLVSEVPEGAAIEPIEVGPMTLIGVRARSEVRLLSGVVWVESYWRSDARLDRHLMLSSRGVPVERFGWIWYGEHEPCDWAWPTSRWVPGVIYRDEMMLRPPPALRSLAGGLARAAGLGSPISVSMGLTDGEQSLAQTSVLLQVPYGVPFWLLELVAVAGLGSLVLTARWWRR